MDVVSHGLWGGASFGRKSKKYFWVAFLVGILPDVIPFTLEFLRFIFEYDSAKTFTPEIFPPYVFILYSLTHSLIIFSSIFLVVWFLAKKPYLPLLAWGLHVLMDIPTHSDKFFPTPFLWPISDFTFNGTSWGTPLIFFGNWGALILIYLAIWLYRKKSHATIKTYE